MRLIDADALARDLDPRHLVEALRAGHAAGRMGMVERLHMEEPGSDNVALTWAGWERERGLAVKTATVFPGNGIAGHLPNIQSVVVLFDGASGTPLATIHGESFTRMKTAADSALAADILARPDVETLVVMGTGGQAATHVRFHLAMRPSLRRVVVWGRAFDRAQRLAASLSRPGLEVVAARDAEPAIREADLVSCLTASPNPVLRGDWLRPGSHVDLVGAFTPAMRESDDAVVRRGRLFADSLRFGIMTCGDYAAPIEAGVIAREAILGDLFGLCSGLVAGRRAPDDITVFKNGGGGHLDLMAARALYDLSGRRETDHSARQT